MIRNLKLEIRNFLAAVLLMYSGAIGSGIFILPYVFFHSNIIFAVLIYIFIVLITLTLNLFYTRIILATQDPHQLPGYAEIYLGRRFRLLAILNILLLVIGALIAFSKLFHSFFTPFFATSTFTNQVFYVCLVIIIYTFKKNYHTSVKSLIPIILFLFPLFIFIYSLISPVFSYISDSYLVPPNFLFFAPVLFALSGFTIIPEVRKLTTNLTLPVIFGTLLTSLIYLLFILTIIFLSFGSPSIDTISGLYQHPFLIYGLGVFGIIAILHLSSCLLEALSELFQYDLKITSLLSSFLPLLILFFIFLFSKIPLLSIISLTGHITILVSALLICLIRLKIPHTFFTKFLVTLIMTVLFISLFFS